MEISILFLLSCVFTARFFQQRKMKAATAVYSVLFTVVLVILLLALDFPIVRSALSNLIGSEIYVMAHDCMYDAINTTVYGISMFGVICAVFTVQLTFTLLHAAHAVVRCFIHKAPARRFKKNYSVFASKARNLYLPKRINILYCRMLN